MNMDNRIECKPERMKINCRKTNHFISSSESSDEISLEERSVIDNLSPVWGIMLTMQENLNVRIGTQRWKKFVSATFWNYTSTPINFTITLFTALSAGQTGTKSQYLSESQLFYILFTTFVLSIVNTFFNLKEKAKINYESSKIYEMFGSDFEKIYFIEILNNNDVLNKLNYYRELQDKINDYSSKESIEYANYLTEIIFLIAKYCCFYNKLKQINFNERYWVLDGRPNKFYPKDFRIDMPELFRYNFDEGDKLKREPSFFTKPVTTNTVTQSTPATQEYDDENEYHECNPRPSSNQVVLSPERSRVFSKQPDYKLAIDKLGDNVDSKSININISREKLDEMLIERSKRLVAMSPETRAAISQERLDAMLYDKPIIPKSYSSSCILS